MAGSKIFLEPILADTVGGIQTAVDEVVTVLDPVPEKIDEQILMLSKVANVIGSSVNNIAVTDGDEFSFLILQLPNSYELQNRITDETEDNYVVTKDYQTTFVTYVNGTFDIKIPAINLVYYLITNTLTGKEQVSISYELKRNNTTVKSGVLYYHEEANGTVWHYSSSVTTEALKISGINCAANDEFELTITLSSSVYAGGGVNGRADLSIFPYYTSTLVNAGYKLVDIVDRGIIVQE